MSQVYLSILFALGVALAIADLRRGIKAGTINRKYCYPAQRKDEPVQFWFHMSITFIVLLISGGLLLGTLLGFVALK
ncbi:hypothetical protein [uncultured Sphingorhabdus sp.]|uniref:hypothetical protein n=1 Tax=uncultured Sphingorhabdus sp. TaxID=1686106 RepID=UPI0026339D0C|nr:hypothetical protein [uncultured Sphingorhabdus sp.]HMS18922.1 hypothetical protein [Sphingorhabdus sp.]